MDNNAEGSREEDPLCSPRSGDDFVGGNGGGETYGPAAAKRRRVVADAEASRESTDADLLDLLRLICDTDADSIAAPTTASDHVDRAMTSEQEPKFNNTQWDAISRRCLEEFDKSVQQDQREGEQRIWLTVLLPDDKKVRVSVTPASKVSQLKEVVARETAVEVPRQRLVYFGKPLGDDEKQLQDYGIDYGIRDRDRHRRSGRPAGVENLYICGQSREATQLTRRIFCCRQR